MERISPAKEQARKDQTAQERGIEETTEERKEKATRAAHLIGAKVNCPCKWTNSIGEEDDEGSSWKLERAKPEELASLEAPDDEGYWCWPKRNRVTRWRKREDQRPTFHYLAEDDGEKQASEGLHLWSNETQEEPSGTMHPCGQLGSSGERNAEEHVSRNTIFAKIISDLTWCRFTNFELI